MPSRPFAPVLAAVLLLLGAGAVHAADARGSRANTARLAFSPTPTTGLFEKNGDRNWCRVALSRGRT